MLRYIVCLTATTAVAQSATWYEEMKIGPAWSNTFEDHYQGAKRTAALKGILLDLGGETRALFDTETLRLVTAYQGKWTWGATPWTGQHGELIQLNNKEPIFNSASLPGWADAAGSFDDSREIQGYGNLKHASFKGYYRHGEKIVFHYQVHGADVLETLAAEGGSVTRSLSIQSHSEDLMLSLADSDKPFTVAGGTAKFESGLELTASKGAELMPDPKAATRLIAKIAKSTSPTVIQFSYAKGGPPKVAAVPDFKTLIAGGAPLYPEIIETKGVVSGSKPEAYLVDIATLPTENPWKANTRFGGFDFIDEDSAALSSWNGDVWVVKGLAGDWSSLKWQRIASGLFETLGVKVVKGVIHVQGRDQITQLIDLNGDGETDHFKTFNRDVIISSNFHEFAFDLQTDKAGNFYFAKASPVRGGGNGFDRILPHHGIVAKISPDGKKFEVVATGLRAPGGMGIGPNGEITTGENEGTWQPACKINYIKGDVPKFLGTEDSRHFLKTEPFTEPLCYLPMTWDNSGGSQVWVPEGSEFGIPSGTLLHLSYGQSSIYRVLPTPRGETLQGGVVKMPILLQSSAMRARFHTDKSMYVLGFRGWQTNAATECAFQRVRYVKNTTVPIPEKVAYTAKGIQLTFGSALDPELAEDATSYSAERWNYVRSKNYGSGDFAVDQPDVEAEKRALENSSKENRKRDAVVIESAKLLPDGKTVDLVLAGMKPSMQLKVGYDLEDKEGVIIKGDFVGTIYKD